MIYAGIGLLFFGCQAPATHTAIDPTATGLEQHKRLFGEFDLPKQIGSVENVGLQLPSVSPDGNRLLYLRVDTPAFSPMTLLGSGEPQDTPESGTLSIWLRPVTDRTVGQRISRQRWAHSAIWSDNSDVIAYVANEPPGSLIVRLNLKTGEETALGVAGVVNCLPRFDDNDQTLLFCAGPRASGPFRVYRQVVGEPSPTPLTPDGLDCVLPLMVGRDGGLLCARVEGDHFNWVRAGSDSVENLAQAGGVSQRAGLLQTWAGISLPISPDRKNFLFYDGLKNRVSVYRLADKWTGQHRLGSQAACWLNQDVFALATPEGLFAVNAFTAVNVPLLSDSWVPVRFVPETAKLFLLGKEKNLSRFSIVEIHFTARREG